MSEQEATQAVAAEEVPAVQVEETVTGAIETEKGEDSEMGGAEQVKAEEPVKAEEQKPAAERKPRVNNIVSDPSVLPESNDPSEICKQVCAIHPNS